MQRRKRRKPRYGRIAFSFLIPLSIVYFLIQSMFSQSHATYIVPVGTLSLEAIAPVVVIRNEVVLETELSGKITYFFNEGDLVNKGTLLAEIFNDGSNETLEVVNERVLERKQTEFDYNLLSYEIENIRELIVFHLDAEDFLPIPRLKRDLLLKMDRMDRMREDHRFLTNRSLSYAQQTVGEGVLLEGQKKAIASPANGIMSFMTDGLESFINIENVYNIHFKELKNEEVSSHNLVRDYTTSKSQLFRLIDPATYYLGAIIPNDAIETYQNATYITVEIEGHQMTGMVIDVFTESDGAVCIIQMKERFPSFHNKRWIDAKLIREDYLGLKVPTDSIINQSGRLGVYALDSNKRLKFTPIKILGYDDEYAIISNEQFYDSDQGLVRSIRLGQEIARNAHLYKDGDRIE